MNGNKRSWDYWCYASHNALAGARHRLLPRLFDAPCFEVPNRRPLPFAEVRATGRKRGGMLKRKVKNCVFKRILFARSLLASTGS